jgi:hypothetical protein
MSGELILYGPAARQPRAAQPEAAPMRLFPRITAREVILECLLGTAACCLAGCGGFFLSIGQTVIATVFGVTAVLIVVYHAATVELDDDDEAFTSEDRE